MSPGPPLYRSSSGLLLPQSVDGPSHVKSSSPSLHYSTPEFRLPVRCIPTIRSGSHRRRQSVPYGAGIPDPPYDLLPPVEKAPLRRRSPLRPLRGHGAVVPLLARQPASLLLVWTDRGLVFSQAPMAAAADCRTLLSVYAICRLPPPRPRFLAALGLQSSPASSSPFSDFHPVRPGGV
jgi:hypothetical protein